MMQGALDNQEYAQQRQRTSCTWSHGGRGGIEGVGKSAGVGRGGDRQRGPSSIRVESIHWQAAVPGGEGGGGGDWYWPLMPPAIAAQVRFRSALGKHIYATEVQASCEDSDLGLPHLMGLRAVCSAEHAGAC